MSKIYEELRLPEIANKEQVQKETAVPRETNHSEKVPQKDKSVDEWYLRVDGKSVYGPVALSELNDWTMQCRIGPDHEISTDKQKWIAAKDVPELKMEWMVKLVDGTSYGPLNVFAVHHLISDGIVAPDAELVNHLTGETSSANKLLVREVTAIEDQNKQLAKEIQQKDELLKAEQEQSRKLEQELSEALRQKVPVPLEKDAPPKLIRQHIRERTADRNKRVHF